MKHILILIVLLSFMQLAYANVQPPKDLWKGVLAESVSEGYEGMYAVTCVVKNRIEKGMSIGLSGMKRKDLDGWISKNTTESHRKMARSLVEAVFNGKEDITYGSTHYENLERFGVPYWATSMKKTVKIGSHTFYK